MGDFANLSTKKIQGIVGKRNKLVRRIVTFIDEITLKIGRETERHTGSCNTHIRRELKDFHGLNFFSDTGQSMMGGNSFSIVMDSEKIFSVSYQTDLDECRVDVFSDGEQWLRRLQGLMRNKSRILAQLEAKKQREENQEHRKDSRQEKRTELLAKAKRLGL